MARPITYDPELALQRAMDLFWKHGFHAVSVELLVRSTGLNRHSLYSRYGNKFGLLEQALTRYCDEAVASIDEILSMQGDPRARIERLLRLRHPTTEDEFWQRVHNQGCLVTRTVAELRDSHPTIRSSLDRLGNSIFRGLSNALREAREMGRLGPSRDPQALATVLTSGFMTFATTPEPDERIDAFLSLLD